MIYQWKNPNGLISTCDIERFDDVILITELDSNSGPSITNGMESLLEDILNTEKTPFAPETIQVVEHYNRGVVKDTFDLVSFDYNNKRVSNIRWKSITALDYIEMINYKGDLNEKEY